jgi:hypothetical protein
MRAQFLAGCLFLFGCAVAGAADFAFVGHARGAARAGRPFVADAGFDEFVRGNWESLAGGTALEVPFLVPSRLSTLPFRVRKVRADRRAGEDVSVFRLSLAGPLGWFLPDIDVRYRGLTNIRDASGATVEAEIVFAYEPGASSMDAQALRAQPLAARCE